jgi:hypothetical protein
LQRCFGRDDCKLFWGVLNLLLGNIQWVFWPRSANSNDSKLSPMIKRMSAMQGDGAKEIMAAKKVFLFWI